MKQILATILLVCISTCNFAQNKITKQKVIQIIGPQTFYLNGKVNGNLGGKNRNVIAVNLPFNTVEWYYSFSTSKDENTTPALNLLGQITKLYDPTGVTAMATNTLFAPSGISTCDIYLLDDKNTIGFLEKGDNWRNTYQYIASGTRENYSSGIINIKDVKSGNLSLGFKNPSLTDGLAVTIEVVAIVESEIITKPTDNQSKAILIQNIAEKAYLKNDYDKALELFNKVIELDKNNNVYNKIGNIYLLKNDYLKAIDTYSTAIVLAKKNPNAKAKLITFKNELNKLKKDNLDLQGIDDILDILKTEINLI